MSDNNNEDLRALEDSDNITMILSLDDGTELECIVLTILEVNGNDYIALLPTEGSEAEEGEVFLYRFNESEDGEPVLTNIEDDDEFEMVSDAFDEYLDEQDFDEIVSGEEE